MKPSYNEMLLDLIGVKLTWWQRGMIRILGKRPDKSFRGKRANLDLVKELWTDEELKTINEALFNNSEPTVVNVNDLL